MPSSMKEQESDLQLGWKSVDAQRRRKRKRTSKEIAEESYFDSTEARRLFQPRDGEGVLECLHRRIKKLHMANETVDGWRLLVENPDACSPTDVFHIRREAALLCHTYDLVLKKEMPCKGGLTATIDEVCEIQGCFARRLSTHTVRKLQMNFRTREVFSGYPRGARTKSHGPQKPPCTKHGRNALSLEVRSKEVLKFSQLPPADEAEMDTQEQIIGSIGFTASPRALRVAEHSFLQSMIKPGNCK